jgi:hypothetical protein
MNWIAWDPVPNAAVTNYNLYWTENGTDPSRGNGARIPNVIRRSASSSWFAPSLEQARQAYCHRALRNGTQYRYVVVAVNDLGEGAASAVRLGIPSTATAAPETPVIAGTCGPTVATWSLVTGATSYDVYLFSADAVVFRGNEIVKRTSVVPPYELDDYRTIAYLAAVSALNSRGESGISGTQFLGGVQEGAPYRPPDPCP